MHLKYSFLIFSLIAFSLKKSLCESENILFFHLISSYSHRIAVWPLVEELAARGHNVTFLQIYPNKNPNPNVTEFIPLKLEDLPLSEFPNPITTRLKGGTFGTLKGNMDVAHYGLFFCEKFLDNPDTKTWIDNNKFDLVFVDFICNECAYGLAYKWNSKVIVYHTTHPSGVFGPEIIGFMQTGELSWIPDIGFLIEMPMNFFSRVLNVLLATYMHLLKDFYYYPALTNMLRDKLNIPDMPSIRDLVDNSSLAFYNSHFSEEHARSLPPAYVSVPALHAWGRKPKPLPKDIAEFVKESGDDGFIYVAFGSEADITTGPKEFFNLFIDGLSQSNISVLWKIVGKRPDNLAKNVFTKDWMPQFDILASTNCKAFVTHGGLLSTQEAVLNAIPLIVIPLFAEQDYNADRVQFKERGIKLDPNTLTKEKLLIAIEEIKTNEKYKKNMEKVAKQLKDQLNTPLETGVYWTEYVLRNEDTSSLKPLKSKYHYWFQVYSLDVWTFLILVLIILIYIIYSILKFVVSTLTRILSVTKVKKLKTK